MPVRVTHTVVVDALGGAVPPDRVQVTYDPQTRRMSFLATSEESPDAAKATIRRFLASALAQVDQVPA